MREVANFMQMYPAYTLRAALDMHAVSFFSLLDEGYRLRNAEYLMLLNLYAFPYMSKQDRTNFVKQLEWLSKDPADILKSSTKGSSAKDIKRALGG